MKFMTLQIKYDMGKLTALQKYAEKKEVSIEEEMVENLTRLYEKYVPAPVREFIDMNTEDTEESKKTKKQKQKSEDLVVKNITQIEGEKEF